MFYKYENSLFNILIMQKCRIIFSKSNAIVINYFIIFLQNVDVSTSYWFLSKLIINITFSFTNNHSPHQKFVKNFVK